MSKWNPNISCFRLLVIFYFSADLLALQVDGKNQKNKLRYTHHVASKSTMLPMNLNHYSGTSNNTQRSLEHVIPKTCHLKRYEIILPETPPNQPRIGLCVSKGVYRAFVTDPAGEYESVTPFRNDICGFGDLDFNNFKIPVSPMPMPCNEGTYLRPKDGNITPRTNITVHTELDEDDEFTLCAMMHPSFDTSYFHKLLRNGWTYHGKRFGLNYNDTLGRNQILNMACIVIPDLNSNTIANLVDSPGYQLRYQCIDHSRTVSTSTKTEECHLPTHRIHLPVTTSNGATVPADPSWSGFGFCVSTSESKTSIFPTHVGLRYTSIYPFKDGTRIWKNQLFRFGGVGTLCNGGTYLQPSIQGDGTGTTDEIPFGTGITAEITATSGDFQFCVIIHPAFDRANPNYINELEGTEWQWTTPTPIPTLSYTNGGNTVNLLVRCGDFPNRRVAPVVRPPLPRLSPIEPNPPNSYNHFGSVVSMNANGDYLVISSQYDGSYQSEGGLWIYKKAASSGYTKIQFCGPPPRADPHSRFGSSSVIDPDTGWVAVSAINDNSNTGAVYIYKADTNNPELIDCNAPTIRLNGDKNGDVFGKSLSLSKFNPKRLVVGAPAQRNPYVRVFELDSAGNWNQLAHDIKSHTDHHQGFGTSVAIQDDANTIVVGTPQNTHFMAYVYEYRNGVWSQRGPEITSTTTTVNANCGDAVAIAKNGQGMETVVVVGCSYHDIVRSFIFDSSKNEWVQLGKDIMSIRRGEKGFGRAVALSSDANALVIGNPYSWNNQGEVTAYTWNNAMDDWVLLQTHQGTGHGGYTVAISEDESIFAYGNPGASVGVLPDVGQVVVSLL